MPTTRADISHGRYAQEIELLVRNALDAVEGLVAYQVEDQSGECFVLVSNAEDCPTLTVGDQYRVESAFGADAQFDANSEFSTQYATADEHACPNCDGELTYVSGLETPPNAVQEYLKELNRPGIHLVLATESQVSLLSGDDDWRPFRNTHSGPPSQPAEYRCNDCAFSAPENELRHYVEHGGESPVEPVLNNAAPAESQSEMLGMSTGGAKDIDNFRENIENGYLPDEDALTPEGLFYDYYFDTDSGDEDTDALFYPSYSTAVSDHPISDETEYYLSVGLNSTLSVEEFERRRLNLVAVLDVSGSMGSPFDQYYYDEHGQRREVETDSSASKMAAATESLAALTKHLEDQDKFGVVLYNSDSHVAKPLSLVGETDMDAIRGHIREVQSGGGTNLSAGLETAIDLLQEYETTDATTVENRIVFMTDMMPNTGVTGRNSISGTIEAAADRGIYTTFIGMGIDANADLVESLSKIRGANHYFVHSAEEFERRLDDEFEYMVTPLVFDLQLELSADTNIEAVYGSPTADRATGQLMHVSTLFPSPTEDGETRGGVVLLKLADKPTSDLQLTASWEEIGGTTESSDVHIGFDGQAESFQNTGIQKAVCLARYCSDLQEWVRSVAERSGHDDWQPMGSSQRARDRWERESTSLHVEDDHRERFKELQEYIDLTAEEVADEDLGREVELLQTLIDYEAPIEHDLSKETLTRLRDLVELAPTKNAELAEAWGLKTGSEVHQYLETHLDNYYYRGEDKLIRPTEEATLLAESIIR